MADTHRPLAAALWMTGSIAAFTAMAVATRAIRDRHDTFEILAYRSLLGLLLVLAAAAVLGRLHRISARRLPGHVLRNGFHFTGQALWFWAITQIPLAQVFALEFTSPLWVILLSPLVLGERITRGRLAAAGLGFLGVLLVAQPDFGRIQPGVLAAAGCALFFAASMLMTKRLTRGEDVVSILFWLTLLQSAIGLALSLRDGAITPPDAGSLPWLALIGLAGLLAHLCLTRALSLAPASFVGPVDFVRLPVIALIGAAFYAEPVGWSLGLGAGLILLANWLSLRTESRAPRTQRGLHNSVTRRH
ncbi:DMT family transporter [Rhodobacter sp. Har01]|uniref:DMT family transporter n=1 Tax=Rhodobacter sp. Har01 TaxID=2883999 RepID=UPI001D09206B|nr:DMT family transporter [Rhodobacter sp. Har01]MCB6177078.1 DMT family transporter [Rhodobacter sp. Har01]